MLKKNKFVLAGIGIGAIAGYLYYDYIGCLSGSCPITSQPVNSTLYGAVMGAFGEYVQQKIIYEFW